jgi:O-antigen ligase
MPFANGNLLVFIALFGWIPVVFYLFLLLPARRAVSTALLVGWLFLPVASYDLPGFFDYNKATATCLNVFLAAALFDKDRRLWNFRPTRFDLPMLVWCLCPFVTSLSNDLGVYDGLSAAIQQTILWGLPYVMGRAYFADFKRLREFAIVLFIGGLIYIPLCLYEIHMSPQLHSTIYGFHQHDFSQTMRFGGWRPTIFLQHGLAVGLFMCMTSLIGTWLWYRMPSRIFPGRSVGWLVVLLLITSVLVKSWGALVLLALGLLVLVLSTMLRTRVLAVLLLSSIPLYIAARTVGGWSGDQLLALAQLSGSQERVESLLTRFRSEYYLMERAKLQPLLGWGRWDRSLVGDENNIVKTTEGWLVKVIPDSFWIVTFGMYGLFGLVSITIAILMPLLLLIRRFPASSWATPEIAPVAVLAMTLGLYMLDNLINDMVNPLFTLAAGGVTGTLRGLRKEPACRIKPHTDTAIWIRENAPLNGKAL